ncbi:hypothetical protein J8L88_09525 [Aquimarina sp. MMG015]|uniref:hypothetical protein n=1 Tax=Aquimarina sp. MMG015 TaxID=2822689 RepID=UPI001B3A15D8|nr:hypothetical protein [Aquimarina sp. MMG015]MBQ4803086.1 hypothetical protein [Aquimarina sp. MMG015]
MLLVATTAIFALGSETSSNDQDKIVEYLVEKAEDGSTTCYARHCVTRTGTDGYEYKECSDWEEVDCRDIQPAQ